MKAISFKISCVSLFLVLLLLSCNEEDNVSGHNEDLDYTSKIDSLSSKKIGIGDTILIYGKNFGDKRNVSTVEFSGIPVDDESYLSWSDTKIELIVPEGAKTGGIYLNQRGSKSVKYEVEQTLFAWMIEFFVMISLGITVIFIYLKINKIWKRKHEREVADSQSLAGLAIYILNCVLWVVYYALENDTKSMIDTSIYIFEGTIFFLIGTGIFVRGQAQFGAWHLIKRALRIERSEADYLLKKFFKPKNADKIIDILHQLAMIDEELDPKEQELIESFAREWNIDYSAEKMNKGRKAGAEHNYIKLRNSVADYLEYDPPHEQVAQLRDMMTALVNVDEKVTNEEELIHSELMGLIAGYLDDQKDVVSQRHHVLIVPQQPEHETIIKEAFPEASRLQISGGVAYSIGSYYSQKYADMICKERRKINMFTIVHSPEENEEIFYSNGTEEK